MKIKYNLKNHISNTFIYYLLAVILVPLLCSYLIFIKNKPKATERFSFFSEVTYVDEGEFKQSLFNILPEDLQIDLYDMDKDDNLFRTYFSSYGLNSDVCLLSKTTLDKFQTIDFVNLTSTKWDKEDNYHFEDYSIGVHIVNMEYFNVSDTDETYYLLALKKSVHLNGIVENSKTDQVDRVLEYLVNNG